MRYEITKQLPVPWQLLAICAVGAAVGILSSVLLPAVTIALLGGVLYLLIIGWRPQFAVLAILLVLATVFNEYALPTFSVGFGHVSVSDLLLLLPLGIILVRAWADPGFKLIGTPLDIPLVGFYAVALFSTILAIISGSITFNQSLGELRVVNLYLIFFVVTNLIRDEKHFRGLLKGLFVLTFFVAVLMIIQYFLGEGTPILPGRVETLFTGTQSSPGVTRILPPGQSLVLVGLVTLTVLLVTQRNRLGFLPRALQLLVIAVAVALTFNRNFWVAAVIALALVGLFVSLSDKVRYLNMALFIVLGFGLLTFPARIVLGSEATGFFESLSTRFSTLLDPSTLNEGSLRNRAVENQYAIPHVIAHPVIGTGLGSDYRGWDHRIDFVQNTNWDKFAYVHDGHLWIMLKTGLLGYVLFILTLSIFVVRGLTNWRKVRDPYWRGIMLAFTALLIGMLPATIVNPIFGQSFWAPVIGIIMGINERILILNREPPAEDWQGPAFAK